MFATSRSLNMTQPTIQESLPARAATHAAEEPTLWEWLTAAEPHRFMLPLTGLWILGLDWLIFTKNMFLSLGMATPLAAVAGFALGGAGTYLVQRRFAKESVGTAGLKGLLAGIVVGIPFPLAGSAVGSWILIASGLSTIKDRLLRK